MSINPVVFVGAGPGDPDLITVKGQKALQQADLIIYAGSLVPRELLTWNPRAEAVDSAPLNLDEIVEMIQKAHGEGKKVVRLHTGDPSLYGAIFEQMRALDKYQISYKVIPGVTAAFAAAAAMGMEYTLPEVTQTLILTRISGRTPVPDQEGPDPAGGPPKFHGHLFEYCPRGTGSGSSGGKLRSGKYLCHCLQGEPP